MYAIAARLERDGYAIEARKGEVRDLALSIAAHGFTIDQIAAWLEERSKPI